MNEQDAILALGGVEHTFRRTPERIRQLLFATGLGGIVAAFFLYGAFSGRIDLAGRIVLAIIGVAFLTPFFAGVYVLVTRRALSLTLHRRGFVVRRRGKSLAVLWDDIASVTESQKWRIEKKNGEVFKIPDHIEDFQDAAERIREETLARLLPPAAAKVERDAGLAFPILPGGKFGRSAPYVGTGELKLTRDGILVTARNLEIFWDDVEEYGQSLAKNREEPVFYFYLRDGSEEFRVDLAYLPNGHLLFALCEKLTSEN